MVFVDTNIYFHAHDVRLPEKQAACRSWLVALGARRLGKTNLQVANDFADVVLRKRRDISPDIVFSLVDDILVWGSAPIDSETVATAQAIHLRYGYSWWDCLLLASAIQLGCTHFLSEDLQDGQRIDTLTIVDPFAHSPEQILISR
ncbi:PIN domain-containing protein [Mesorhizobium marinum]|uniref:PIN domain-containing protein n=1 Tax=Mesorhizobium marinum TaxID=3228790 RepID=UPI00346723BB